MGAAIGSILPLALGIAISPIPIIAAILMLLSPKARGTSVGFLIGWVLGIVVAIVVFTLLSSLIPPASDGSKPVSGVIKIVLGVGLLFLAARQWRSRPKGDAEPALPKWMAAIDTMTAPKALGLGFLLAAVNPKNLLMGAAAGLALGSAGASGSEEVVAIVVFVVIAASTVAVPVIAYLAASSRMAAPLQSLRTWLVHNNATVMSILLLLIGVVVIGKGLADF